MSYRRQPIGVVSIVLTIVAIVMIWNAWVSSEDMRLYISTKANDSWSGRLSEPNGGR